MWMKQLSPFHQKAGTAEILKCCVKVGCEPANRYNLDEMEVPWLEVCSLILIPEVVLGRLNCGYIQACLCTDLAGL